MHVHKLYLAAGHHQDLGHRFGKEANVRQHLRKGGDKEKQRPIVTKEVADRTYIIDTVPLITHLDRCASGTVQRYEANFQETWQVQAR